MRVNRMAPACFSASPSDAAKPLWRGLTMAYAPFGAAHFQDRVQHLLTRPNPAANGLSTATVCGRAVRFVNAGLYDDDHTIHIPKQAPFAMFAFLVRHDSGTTLQCLFGNGSAGNGGWSVKLNYNAGQIGIVRFTIADERTTTLGAVPTGTPSAIAMSHDGSTARFMLNGKFENVSSGQPANITGSARVGCASDSLGGQLEPVQDASLHVLYCWNRVVTDHEMLRLWMDPWAPLRPAAGVYLGAGGGAGGGTGVRSFAAVIG